MRVIHDIPDIQGLILRWKQQQQRVAFVPTMGNLHQGHLQLVEAAQAVADKVVVSVFVNPLQFPPGTDFEAYPRTLDDDAEKLRHLNVDALFAPVTQAIYPQAMEAATKVVVPQLSDILCGEFRPGHFAGVTTVVAKLFHLVPAHVAVFGEKDFQQLTIIKKMVQDLSFAVEIQSVATVRETDGLAMSSRNQYLSAQQREVAPRLYQVLNTAKQDVLAKTKSFTQIEADAMQALKEAGFKPEYVSVRNRETLAPASVEDPSKVILAAAWLGKARLIDNLRVD